LKAKNIMTRNPVTVDITGTVQEVADAMFMSEVRHIPIVRHGVLVGMVSDRDLRNYMLPRSEQILRPDDTRARLDSTVELVMRSDARTVTADTPVTAIVDLLVQEKIGAVPVLAPDTRELLGIVSYLDILRVARPLF
jgi:acetoin utilization protein AcuB